MNLHVPFPQSKPREGMHPNDSVTDRFVIHILPQKVKKKFIHNMNKTTSAYTYKRCLRYLSSTRINHTYELVLAGGRKEGAITVP